MSGKRAGRMMGYGRSVPKARTRSVTHGRWVWLVGGGTLALVVGFAVLVGVEFSASRMRARSESPDLPGIDVAGLDPEQVQVLITRARNERCPCPCGFTLAECRHKDSTCPLSGPILDGIVKDYRNRGPSPGRAE